MFSEVYVKRVLNPCYHNWKKRFVAESFQVHRAHLVMLAGQGIVDASIVHAIKEGMDAIERDFQFPDLIPAETEDLYFVFEKELARRIGEDKAGFLHTARSRNDMDTTVFRIYVRSRLLGLLDAILELFGALLIRMQDGSASLPIVLYTHGQPANVSTLSHYLSSILMDLLECTKALETALEAVDQSSMGACAITTTGFPIDRDVVSKLLGFAFPIPNSYQAIATSHWLTFPASALSLFLNDMGRFVADLSHKASCEVGMLSFPDSLVQASSIMPQKRNPVILEHIRIQANLASGILGGMNELFRNVPYQDVNEVADAPVDEFARAIDLSLSAIDLFKETILNVGVDQKRVQEIAIDFGITTTELADSLVRDFAVSFREAHGLTAAFVRSGYDKKHYGMPGKRVGGRSFPTPMRRSMKPYRPPTLSPSEKSQADLPPRAWLPSKSLPHPPAVSWAR
ncbi:argininosuccinate lyase [Treponema sp.]